MKFFILLVYTGVAFNVIFLCLNFYRIKTLLEIVFFLAYRFQSSCSGNNNSSWNRRHYQQQVIIGSYGASYSSKCASHIMCVVFGWVWRWKRFRKPKSNIHPLWTLFALASAFIGKVDAIPSKNSTFETRTFMTENLIIPLWTNRCWWANLLHQSLSHVVYEILNKVHNEWEKVQPKIWNKINAIRGKVHKAWNGWCESCTWRICIEEMEDATNTACKSGSLFELNTR